MYVCSSVISCDGVVIRWPRMTEVSARDARRPMGASKKDYGQVVCLVERNGGRDPLGVSYGTVGGE